MKELPAPNPVYNNMKFLVNHIEKQKETKHQNANLLTKTDTRLRNFGNPNLPLQIDLRVAKLLSQNYTPKLTELLMMVHQNENKDS